MPHIPGDQHLDPRYPGTDIPSDNLHEKGLHFVENITGMGSNPENTEMDPNSDTPNIISRQNGKITPTSEGHNPHPQTLVTTFYRTH
jgi:hypothetical protein